MWWLELIVAGFYVYFFISEVFHARRAGCRRYFSQVGTLLSNSNMLAYVLVWILRAVSLDLAPLPENVVASGNLYVHCPAAACSVVVTMACIVPSCSCIHAL